jgi:hypothetical protein
LSLAKEYLEGKDDDGVNRESIKQYFAK